MKLPLLTPRQFVGSHAIVIVGACILAVLAYQHFHDPVVERERGRLKGELASAKRELAVAHRETADAREQLDSALARVDTVIKWRTAIVQNTPALPATASPHDTIAMVARALEATRAAGDSVVRACSQLASSCQLFREKATAELASWERRYAVLDSLYRKPKPAKRFNLSLSIGYGVTMNDNTFVRSPFIGASVGRAIVSW